MSKSSKASAPKKTSSDKRELTAPNNDKRFTKRNADGTFKESDDVSKSLSRDIQTNAKKKVKPGYGDKGDQKTRKS